MSDRQELEVEGQAREEAGEAGTHGVLGKPGHSLSPAHPQEASVVCRFLSPVHVYT